jgi:hypothetical protein
MPWRFGFVVLALALVVASGCSRQMAKVQGKVLLDGSPLEGATVTFMPEGGSGLSASGFTGEDGVFTLTTRTTGDGAVAGDYHVIITKQAKSSMPEGAGDASNMKGNWEQYMKTRPKDGPPKTPSAIPPQYSDSKNPVLKCKVPPDGPVEFNLRSKGGA